MKMTKRIAAMAACAVMTVTSMVGMGTSAVDVTVNDNYIVSEVEQNDNGIMPYADGDVFNGLTKGAYYSPDSSGFILISGTNKDDARCTFSNVYVGESQTGDPINQYISGVPSTWAAGITGGGSVDNRVFTASFEANSWFYRDQNGYIVRGTFGIIVKGSYTNGNKTIIIDDISYTR